MREFRAWDIEQKCYVEHGFDFRVDGDGYIYRRTWGESVWERTVGLILEQSTGLLDKNGKAIYEGDIIFPGKREVRFQEYKTGLEQGTGFVTYSHEAKHPWQIPFSFASAQAIGSEVIGTIHSEEQE